MFAHLRLGCLCSPPPIFLQGFGVLLGFGFGVCHPLSPFRGCLLPATILYFQGSELRFRACQPNKLSGGVVANFQSLAQFSWGFTVGIGFATRDLLSGFGFARHDLLFGCAVCRPRCAIFFQGSGFSTHWYDECSWLGELWICHPRFFIRHWGLSSLISFKGFGFVTHDLFVGVWVVLASISDFVSGFRGLRTYMLSISGLGLANQHFGLGVCHPRSS